MNLVDTHCHLDQPVFDRDRDEVLTRAAAAGVGTLVIPAIGPDRWDGLLALAAAPRRAGTPHLVVGLGVHPQLLPELDPAGDREILDRLDRLLASGVARAVGECGLDGPAAELSAWGSLERQSRLLEGQLELARAHRLPVLLHVFRAQEAAVRILERIGPLPAGGVLHSYSGSRELVRRWRKLALHFSFTGPVTYPGSTRVHAAAREVPEDRLLVESDAPDQAPRQHRGERNEPARLPLVVEALAAVRGTTPERIAAITGANALRLFGAGEPETEARTEPAGAPA